MFSVKHLTMTHSKDLRVLLDDFSLTVNPGDKIVIIGEEGNGKSTLLSWMASPERVASYAQGEGERICSGEIIGYLPQELPEADREKTVYGYFCEEDAFFEADDGTRAKLFKRLGMDPKRVYSDQRMGTLSGGEKVKLEMLRILLKSPTLLFLDEPSNDIDLETLEWLEKLILDWTGGVVFISHDELLIERTANRVVHLELVRKKTLCRATVANMGYTRYREERLNRLEHQEAQAASDLRDKRIRDEKYRRIAQSVEAAQAHVSRQDPAAGRLLKKKMHAVKSLEARFEREDANMTEKPDVEDPILFRFDAQQSAVPFGKTVLDYSLSELLRADGSQVLARNVSLFVRGPERLGLIGKNGSGKTTLLRLIAQELLARPDLKAAYMPQNYAEELDRDETPVRFLNPGRMTAEETRIRTLLGSLRYTRDEMLHPVRELSGGQKAKLLLLKMNLSGANVLVMDEPTRNFSPLSGPVIREALAAFPGAMICVSHDRKFLREVCTRIVRLTEDGLVSEERME